MNKTNEKLYFAFETEWDKYWEVNVYLVNPTDVFYSDVIVNSSGYGSFDDDLIKTNTVEKSIGTLAPNSFLKVETTHYYEFGEFNVSWRLHLKVANTKETEDLSFGVEKRGHSNWKEEEKYIELLGKKAVKIFD